MSRQFKSQGQILENCPPACSVFSMLWAQGLKAHGLDTFLVLDQEDLERVQLEIVTRGVLIWSQGRPPLTDEGEDPWKVAARLPLLGTVERLGNVGTEFTDTFTVDGKSQGLSDGYQLLWDELTSGSIVLIVFGGKTSVFCPTGGGACYVDTHNPAGFQQCASVPDIAQLLLGVTSYALCRYLAPPSPSAASPSPSTQVFFVAEPCFSSVFTLLSSINRTGHLLLLLVAA